VGWEGVTYIAELIITKCHPYVEDFVPSLVNMQGRNQGKCAAATVTTKVRSSGSSDGLRNCESEPSQSVPCSQPSTA